MSNELDSTYHITFLRHGESIGNAEGYHQGQAKFPLTEKGKAQAEALASRWQSENKKFDFMVASPQSRAKQTAEIVAGALGLEIEYDPVWMERDNGILAGLHHTAVKEKYPQPNFVQLYERVGETGESHWELYLRGGRALQSILHRTPGRYLIVSHGAILNMVLHSIFGITPQPNFHGTWFRFRNTAFATLTFNPSASNWRVEGINDRFHWKEDKETG